MEHPRQQTPVAEQHIAESLLGAYPEVFRSEPSRQAASLLLAHIFLENRNGQAIYNNNFGNLSGSSTWGYYPAAWMNPEYNASIEDDAKRKRYQRLYERATASPPTVPNKFQHFPSADAGLKAYLKLISKDRYAPLMRAAESGDPNAFAHATYSTGYCGDIECRDAGPSFRKMLDGINERGYFAGLRSSVGASTGSFVLMVGAGLGLAYLLMRKK